jgi:hypothetical protein
MFLTASSVAKRSSNFARYRIKLSDNTSRFSETTLFTKSQKTYVNEATGKRGEEKTKQANCTIGKHGKTLTQGAEYFDIFALKVHQTTKFINLWCEDFVSLIVDVGLVGIVRVFHLKKYN